MTSLPRPTEGSKPSFKDVKAGAWYTGWINAAESLNLVQGDGNGTFRPNDTISNQEVITVLMRMLGYNDNLPGAWPTNYVTQANKDEILDDVSIVAAAAAKRGDVAVMVSNALDTELVTYDKDTDEFVLKQTTKSGSDYVTLLADAFKGTYADVPSFAAVDTVRDAAKGTLDWTVDAEGTELDGNYIIDADTRVSVNGGSLFDLEGHQGKVYYTVESGKKYVKFIDVDSYATAVGGDAPALNENGKLEANNKTYNAVKDVTILPNNTTKNSKWKLYFNDDDQVYAVASDKDDTRKAYFVESVGTNSIKLIGNTNETVNMDDEETLIWNGTEFVAPSTLEVGDALIEVAEDELYVLADAKTGVVKSTTSSQVNIDGTNYAGKANVQVLDAEYEDANVDWDEIYGNTVTYLLNKDNSLSAMIVDEVSIGTKLYGVVVGGTKKDSDNWGGSSDRKVTIFTEEGTTVEYDIDEDEVVEGDEDIDNLLNVDLVGKLVQYKLNKDGEIKELNIAEKDLLDGDKDGEIEVKNNAYLIGGKNLTLASNIAVFEITEDDDNIDVALVTRAALLGGGDFEPQPVTFADIEVSAGKALTLDPSVKYFTNSNGTARAMAYTDAATTKYHYGIIGDVWFSNSDYDDALTLVGDDTTYEFKNNTDNINAAKWTKDTVDDGYAIMYKVSGDTITIVAALTDEPGKKVYNEDGTLKGVANDEHKYYVPVKSFTDGLIVTETDVYVTKDLDKENEAGGMMNNIMTDDNTLVCVITKNGKAVEGTLSDIGKNAYVNVPTVDKDGYADIVIVNEYTDYTAVDVDTTVVE